MRAKTVRQYWENCESFEAMIDTVKHGENFDTMWELWEYMRYWRLWVTVKGMRTVRLWNTVRQCGSLRAVRHCEIYETLWDLRELWDTEGYKAVICIQSYESFVSQWKVWKLLRHWRLWDTVGAVRAVRHCDIPWETESWDPVRYCEMPWDTARACETLWHSIKAWRHLRHCETLRDIVRLKKEKLDTIPFFVSKKEWKKERHASSWKRKKEWKKLRHSLSEKALKKEHISVLMCHVWIAVFLFDFFFVFDL